jgi:hypothetical protein
MFHTVSATPSTVALRVRNTGAIFGAIVTPFLCTILYLPLAASDADARLVIGIVLAALMIGGYIAATFTVKKALDRAVQAPRATNLTAAGRADARTEDTFTSLLRGILIGANSCANFGLIWLIFGGVLGSEAALAIGGAIGGITLLSSIGPVSRAGAYQAIVGWGNWLMPMSWLIVALGLLFTLFSALLHVLITLPFGADLTRVGIPAARGGPLAGRSLEFDGRTGSLFMYGGLVANLNYLKTAFNMGNFCFVHYQSRSGHVRHEAGHSLNLAVFGSIFHLLGAIEENFPVVGTGQRAFSEVLAESHDPSPHGPQLLMWP